MRRMPVVMFLNAMIPGAGLVVLRREWLGLATSILFAVIALIFISSRWITPSDVPTWAMYLMLAGMILVWAGSMAMVVHRFRFVSDPELIAEIEQLRGQGADAIAAGDLDEAHRVLMVALSLDDEAAETWLIWSDLMERQNKVHAARVGWKRVLRLSKRQKNLDMARQRLGKKTGKTPEFS